MRGKGMNPGVLGGPAQAEERKEVTPERKVGLYNKIIDLPTKRD